MRKLRFLILLLILSLVSLACSLSGKLTPTEETFPTADLPVTSEPPAEPKDPTIQPTDVTQVPTDEPTPLPVSNNGQIVYTDQGNLWRYIVDSGELQQVTTDGLASSYDLKYDAPLISPDGNLLAYRKNNASYIYDFNSTLSSSFTDGRNLLQWTGSGQEYIFYRGDLICPAVENLEDQVLLNFDLYWADFRSPSTESFIANIAGGLKFPQVVSPDEQYASVMSCGCYSECGASELYYLPTNTVILNPEGLSMGHLAFSPDSRFLLTAERQMFGYYPSPLYIANADLSGITPLFTKADTAPLYFAWSPDQQWIGMTLITIGSDGMSILESQVILLTPDGASQTVLPASNASFVDWSPDGSKVLYKVEGAGTYTLHIYDLASRSETALPMSVISSYFFQADWGHHLP